MNSIDIILCVFLLFGLIRGFFKGFLIELAGLVALIAGIYAAIHYSGIIMAVIDGFLDLEERYLLIISFALTFFIVSLIIVLTGRILTKALHILALGIVNRLTGAAFGLIKMAFFASLFFMFLNQFSAYDLGRKAKESSVLYGPIEDLAPLLLPSILSEIEESDLFDPTPGEEEEEKSAKN